MTLPSVALQELAERLVRRYGRWEELIVPRPTARVYEQVWDEANANAWLIGWCPDHDTGWHDHDDAAASITVLSGQVRELRMRMAGQPHTRLLSRGQTFHVPPSAIHRVQHAGQEPAVTLHCYSPPLRRAGSYSIGPSGELLRSSQSFAEELTAEPALL